ncbi:MAG: MbnP family protein [Bacteroidota bacterium]
MRPLTVISIFLFLLVGCKDDPYDNPDKVALTFEFTHFVDGAPVAMDQLIYQNALEQDFSIKTIKYFISDVKLYKSDNTVISLNDIHYIDGRDSTTVSYTFTNKIHEGDYTKISFVHGLTPINNVTGSLGLDLDRLMEWPIPMGGGYHYMKLEGAYLTEGNYFNFHAGAFEGIPYEIDINIEKPFSVVGDKLNIKLVMEIQNWFTDPIDWDFNYFGPAIMDNHEAQETIQANGHNVYTFEVMNDL